MTSSRNVRAFAFAAIAAALGGCVFPVTQRPLVTEYEPPPVDVPTSTSTQLTARFLGTSTVVLSDGRTTIMTDGYFSRPSAWQLLFQPVKPHRRRIEAGLDAAKVTRAAAIFVAHSHHDHAMDTPYVAQLTGATIVGSSSTKNIAVGVDFPKERIEMIDDGSVCRFGAFTVRIFQTPHSSPTAFPGAIDGELTRSAWVEDYREGGNFTFHVTHPWGTVLIVPSRGVRKGWSVPRPAQAVFLGVGGVVLGAEKLRPFWEQHVAGPGATRVFPIHWDNFLEKADFGSRPDGPKAFRKKKRYLEQLADAKASVEFLPYAKEEVLGRAPADGGELPTPLGPDGCGDT